MWERKIICLSHVPQLGTKPTTQACALTWNPTRNLSVCRTMPNQLSHSGQGKTTLSWCKYILFTLKWSSNQMTKIELLQMPFKLPNVSPAQKQHIVQWENKDINLGFYHSLNFYLEPTVCIILLRLHQTCSLLNYRTSFNPLLQFQCFAGNKNQPTLNNYCYFFPQDTTWYEATCKVHFGYKWSLN